MDYFSRTKKENENSYDIYIENIKGIYCDNNSSLQLIYVLQDGIGISFEGEELIAREGDLIIINQCQSRFIYSENIDTVAIILNISDDYLENLDPVFYDSRYINFVQKENLNQSLLDNLILLYKMKYGNKNWEKEYSMINEILNIMVKEYSDTSKLIYGIEEKKTYLQRIVKLMGKNQLDRLNLKDLSEEMHLSQSYISKIFREVSGVKFTEYVQQLKLYYASYYIRNTSKTMDDVAELVDFGSTKSLNRIFNKYLNVTPSEYRKIYKSKESGSEFNKQVEKLEKIRSAPKFKDYLEQFYPNDFLELDLNNPPLSEEIFRSWAIIRNLNSIGRDYISVIETLSGGIEIDEIVLRFKFDGDYKKLYLIDLNERISNEQFYSLLDMCIREDIRPIIGLDTGILDLTVDGEEELISKKLVLEDFYNMISNAVGTTNMKKFSYIIDVRDVYKYVEDEYRLELYRRYVAMQQRILEAKIGMQNFSWGYEAGNLDNEDFFKIKQAYVKIAYDRIFNPSFIFLEYGKKLDIMNMSIREMNKLQENIEVYMDIIGRIKKELNFPGTRVYMKGISKYMDVSDIDERYKDLFVTMVMIKIAFIIREDMQYVTDFIIKDDSQEDSVYIPRVIDNYGFYTPLYWALFFLKQIKGSLIDRAEGIVVTKNDEDVYVLAYGNALMSYLFALKKNFKELSAERYSLDVKLKNMSGRYKVVTETLSFERGSVLYNLGNFDYYKYLTMEERKLIQKLSIPDLNVDIEEIGEDYIEKIDLSPFTIILKKYIKI